MASCCSHQFRLFSLVGEVEIFHWTNPTLFHRLLFPKTSDRFSCIGTLIGSNWYIITLYIYQHSLFRSRSLHKFVLGLNNRHLQLKKQYDVLLKHCVRLKICWAPDMFVRNMFFGAINFVGAIQYYDATTDVSLSWTSTTTVMTSSEEKTQQ